ncbi:extradiol dioxygenase [Variovorax terrae]|uniref:Extradiol dioxygenase n=1 Tax=Variovorax terrae TaxID=2923278 RepID=A0A9X1VWI9_9BURK|nr:extradiol dioxygenase [Variovorax terrae]MCJ0765106.1 extradiol dioxygenase [Variovorax terrae]
MGVTRLDHFTLRTSLMEETRRFFEQVAGFAVGPRPPFQFPGYWLYSGGTAVVHLAPHDPSDERLAAYLGDRQVGDDTGVVDHIAMRCTDLPAFEERLKTQGRAYRARTVPALEEHQVFVIAPGRLTIEFIFDATETSSWHSDEAGIAVDAQ